MKGLALIYNCRDTLVNTMKPEPWVSLEEIAEHLGVSTDTIHRWIPE